MLVSPFFWSTIKLLPLELNGTLSDYEFLLVICRKLNELINSNNSLNSQVTLTTEAIQALQTDVANIESELEKIKNGDYVSLYLDSIINYINNNLQELVSSIAKFVVFGLTQDGYFCAYIPKNWDFLQFSTIMDGDSPLYGHLCIRF